MDRAQREALHRDLTRLAEGDRDAFHPVFVRLWPVLRAFARSRLDEADAEDAAQEALVKVFARAAAFDPARDGLSWALGIAAYEVKTLRRKRQRRREAPEPPERQGLDDPAPGPQEIAVEREREAMVKAALDAVGECDAATLRAFASGDRPAIPSATFRKRVQRALARLRARWSTPDVV